MISNPPCTQISFLLQLLQSPSRTSTPISEATSTPVLDFGHTCCSMDHKHSIGWLLIYQAQPWLLNFSDQTGTGYCTALH